MQDQLKERLTGAAILVIIVVLLVPEMFRGRPAGGGERSAAATDGAPMRTYTIDLRDAPAAQPPAVQADAAQAPPVQPPPAQLPLAQSPAAAPAAAAAASTPQPEAPAASLHPAAPGAAAATPAVAPVVAAPVAAVPAAAAPATAPKPAPRSVHAGAGASGWTVQVGSFTRRDFAERMVKQVRARGFAVEAVGPDDRGLYRVRSAPLAERAAALALKQKMQARGLKPIVNAAP